MRLTPFQTKSKQLALIAAILLATYNVVLFVIAGFEDHGAAFWISYVFTLLCFAVVAISCMLLRKREIEPKDWMFGYPVLRHCYIYAVIQLVLSVLFMILDSEIDISWTIVFIVQLLLAAVSSIFIISCFYAQETVQEIGTKVKDSTAFVRLLQVDVESIADKSADPEVKRAYKALAEMVRYSDPMSNHNLFELEKQIAQKVNQANESLQNDDSAYLLECCREATLLMTERNKKCKALK